MGQRAYEKAVSLLDSANGEDPNIEHSEGREWPKELLYSLRMAAMLERFNPHADDEIKLAIRGQHVQRWKSPRSAFPLNRQGYHQWRTSLYTFHAELVTSIMAQAGYDLASQQRASLAVAKKDIKHNADSQLLEDVASLVFMEFYLLAFADKHPDYDEDKWIDIIGKTWRKMSPAGHDFALNGKLNLPKALVPIILKAVAPNS
jgi:hypothetical protein